MMVADLWLGPFYVFTMVLVLLLALFLAASYGGLYAVTPPLIAIPIAYMLRKRLGERAVYIVIGSVSPIPVFVAQTVSSMDLHIPRDSTYTAAAWIAGGFLGIAFAFLIVVTATALIEHALEQERN